MTELRQRRKQGNLFSNEDSEDPHSSDIYKRPKRNTRCVMMLKIITVGIILAMTGYITGISYSRSMDIEYDPLREENIIKKHVSLQVSQSPRAYRDWDQYSQMWHRCLNIDGISEDQKNGIRTESLFSPPMVYNGRTMIKHYFPIYALLNSQKTFLLQNYKTSSNRGNFTVPTMYMEESTELISNRSIFPCVCSILLDGGKDSLDKPVMDHRDSGIINAINLEIHEDVTMHPEDEAFIVSAKISMPIFRSFREPFKMTIPHHLNVTFLEPKLDRSSKSWSLEVLNVMFYDPVNIINIINCAHLSQVTWTSRWKLKRETLNSFLGG